jgi:hypothetical protein
MSEIWWKMYIGLHVKYPLFLSDFSETRIFGADFGKILKYQISWKPVQRKPSCSMRTDRRTNMKKLIVAFRNFANAPKTGLLCDAEYTAQASEARLASLWHAGGFPWHSAFTTAPVFYFFCPTSVSIMWRMCIYTHIWLRRDCLWITVATK